MTTPLAPAAPKFGIHMKFVSLLTILLGTAAIVLAEEPTPTPAPAAKPAAAAAETLSAALTCATTEKRQLLLEFFSYQSVESKIVSEMAKRNAAIKALLEEKYVHVRTEIERDPVLRERFKVNRAPTLIVLRTDGTEVDRLIGSANLNDIQAMLAAAATGQSELDTLRAKSAAATADLATRAALAVAYVKRGMHTEAVGIYSAVLRAPSRSGADAKARSAAVFQLCALALRSEEANQATLSLCDGFEAQAVEGNKEALGFALAIHQRLKLSERSVKLFTRLPAGELRLHALGAALPALVEAQQYQAVVDTVDLEDFVTRLYAKPHEMPARPGSANAPAAVKHRASESRAAERRFADMIAPCVEALLGTGQLMKAERVAGRALEHLKEEDIRGRLTEAANRAANGQSPAFIKWMQESYPAPAQSKKT